MENGHGTSIIDLAFVDILRNRNNEGEALIAAKLDRNNIATNNRHHLDEIERNTDSTALLAAVNNNEKTFLQSNHALTLQMAACCCDQKVAAAVTACKLAEISKDIVQGNERVILTLTSQSQAERVRQLELQILKMELGHHHGK